MVKRTRGASAPARTVARPNTARKFVINCYLYRNASMVHGVCDQSLSYRECRKALILRSHSVRYAANEGGNSKNPWRYGVEAPGVVDPVRGCVFAGSCCDSR